jgi:hypothetical protein
MAQTTQPLAVYLHDHLAGAAYALDLVKSIRDNYRGQELGDFAATLHEEIAADKEVLHSIASQFGPDSDVLKDGVAWLAEKVSLFKLSHSDPTGLGLFEALEFLTLGIHGKAALWRVLSVVAERNGGFVTVNFKNLLERADEQERAVEKFRLIAGRNAFLHSSGSR